MKIKDVPQDDQHHKRGDTLYVHFAEDEKGNFVPVLSSGWEVQDTTIEGFIKMFVELEAEAKEKIKKNETSPLEYFMYHYQLDLPLLASQMGFSKRKIKKHLNPHVFKKLDNKTLQEYADFFRIDINELKNFTG